MLGNCLVLLDKSAISPAGRSDWVNFDVLHVVFGPLVVLFFMLLRMLRFLGVVALSLCLPALQFMSYFLQCTFCLSLCKIFSSCLTIVTISLMGRR